MLLRKPSAHLEAVVLHQVLPKLRDMLDQNMALGVLLPGVAPLRHRGNASIRLKFRAAVRVCGTVNGLEDARVEARMERDADQESFREDVFEHEACSEEDE